MSLKYATSLELLHITAKPLFSNRELYRTVQPTVRAPPMPKVDGLLSKVDGLASKNDGLLPKVDGCLPKNDRLLPKVDGLLPNAQNSRFGVQGDKSLGACPAIERHPLRVSLHLSGSQS